MELLAFLIGAGALWVALSARARTLRLERELETLRTAISGGATRPPEAEAPPAPTMAESTPAEPAPAEPAPGTPAVPVTRGWARASGARTDEAATPSAAPAAAREDALSRLGAWLRDHWIYPAAGAALVLSGVFLVQYAVETGLLTPEARLVLALMLAAALGAGGEWLRHRPLAGPILPATLTGAGLVIAMATVLAALHLYDLIAPATALVALALLSLAAIALGWLHGPMLAALGLLAGSAVPFVLGGGGPPPAALFGYFALLALAGLGIDSRRRWHWVTWLALAAPLGAMVLWRLAGGDAMGFALAVTLVAAAAMALPFGRIAPLAEGPRALGRARPLPGVRASFAASATAALGLALLVPGMEAVLALTVLAGLIALWCRRAPALADQMLLPLLALPLWVAWQGWGFGPVLRAFAAPRLPEAAVPLQVSMVLGLALLAGLAMIRRGEAEAPGRHAPWTLAGLILPSAVLAVLETTWQPALELGDYLWTLHAMALAALATMLALRYGERDGGQGPRLGAAAALAFALIGLGLMLMLGQAALTLALALLMVAAAAMERRFDIPALGVFGVLASLALLWRLVLDPGLDWHLSEAPAGAVLASVAATLAGPLLALGITLPLGDTPLRRTARLMIETGLIASASIAAAIVIARLLPDPLGPHARLGLQASVLLVLAWVQMRRAELGWSRLRRGLGWLLGLGAAGLLALAAYPASPVFGGWPFHGRVMGWPVLNDLLLAYLLPAALLILLARRKPLQAAGWGLGAIWAAMAIRHLWQGPDLRIARGIEQGELYAYTFALLAAGAVLLGRALLQARPDLRKLGLVLAGLAAAKAFLIDAAGLDGLLRVGAFLGLGLVLAGLAWLNGWAVAREGQARGDAGEGGANA